MLAKKELSDAQIEEMDADGVLPLAEGVILDVRRLSTEGCSVQRRRLQNTIISESATYNRNEGFRTARTSLFFSRLEGISGANEGMVAQSVPSWNQINSWLKELDEVRKVFAV